MIIFVNGNIASGKSTFLKIMESYGFDVMYEPIEWMRKSGWLQEIYDGKNLVKNQIKFIKHYSGLIKKLDPGKLWLVESGPKMWVNYCNVLDFTEAEMAKVKAVIPDMIYWEIVIKTTPEECYKRVRRRGRKEERKITIDYLRALDIFSDKTEDSDIDPESDSGSECSDEEINAFQESRKKIDENFASIYS